MAKKIKPCDPCASPNWYRRKQKSRYQRDKRHEEQEHAYFDEIFKEECDMVTHMVETIERSMK